MADPPQYDYSALLDHVSQEESKLCNQNDMAHFGHPPAPQLSMFRLSNKTDALSQHDDVVLMVAYTQHFVFAQILSPQAPEGEALAENDMKQEPPFLVSQIRPVEEEGQQQQEQFAQHNQHAQQPIDEIITCLTLVALEDLSLISVKENLCQVVFDNNPKKKRVQFDEASPLESTHNEDTTETATAKIKNLQLRGSVVETQVHFPRVAVIYGTNKSRIVAEELRWNPESKSIVLPLPESLEPLPLDPGDMIKKIQEEKKLAFFPLGGVNHLSTFVMTKGKENGISHALSPVAYVWISYGDGTMLRIHHAAFFRSVLGDELLLKSKPGDAVTIFDLPPTLHERLQKQHITLLLRCEAKFAVADTSSFAIIPLPKYHPSPLAPLTPYKPSFQGKDEPPPPKAGVLSDQEDKEEDETALEACEAVMFTKPMASAATAEIFPTLCFYTSEDQFTGRVEGHVGVDTTPRTFSDAPILGAVVGGTKAVVGGLVGALAWGFGAGSAPAVPAVDADKKEGVVKSVVPAGYFPSLRQGPVVKLFAGYEFHDPPRQVESFSVDPDGNLGATTDSFGRVILLELATKQVIRMWKGFREASCCWLQAVKTTTAGNGALPSLKKKSLFLVIHSRQRRVVEVYRVRHGPRVKSIQVGRDAQIVSCKEWISSAGDGGDYVTSCYIVHSNIPGGSAPQSLEKIMVPDHKSAVAQEQEGQKSSQKQSHTLQAVNPKEAALRLQRLQQLLANTNVPCQLQDVHNALTQITSLRDLAACLDRLAVASVLESKMGVKGTEFQKIALAYCRESLKEAVKHSKGDPASNPHVKLLATKIVYHTQVINAFDILRRFEQGGNAEEDQQVAPRSPWSEEAMGWASTFDMVHGKRPDENGSIESASRTKAEPLTFAIFANACVVPKEPDSPTARDNRKIEVYLTDSSKTRRDVLVHIFKPLLGDIFAFNVVNSIFGALGISEDADYLLKCFGEWYMTLSNKEAARKGFYALYSPMVRWLQEMVTKHLDRQSATQQGVALRALHTFCAQSSDLVKAFMLGALCREAVAKAAIKKEEETYGKISSSEEVKAWDQLLRKLRVCLLVSLRLHGVRIGTFPITVDYVEKGDIFSVYEWLAHDELAMSHIHKEILTLEEACRVSGISFDPSTVAGDTTARFEMLQNACLSAALSEEERTEYLVDFDDDDKLGALLLFLKSHNEPKLLVAHRALLLGSIWSQNPHDLNILGNALVALQSLSIRDDMKSLAAAVRLEVWQTCIRPIYRALLFGFHDVQEVSEHIIAPLFHQPVWVKEFGRLALEILTLLLQIPWSESMKNFKPELDSKSNEGTWPPVKPDFILERLVQRLREVDRSALDMHRVVICALRVSDDIQVMINCVPNFHDCFDTLSLFHPVSPATSAVVAQQKTFLDAAVISHAQKYSGKVLDSFELEEIDILAAIWKMPIIDLRTTWLLSMYECGKDRLVDELLTNSAELIAASGFVQGGVDIICRRLNDMLHSKRKQSPELREVMGLLDADMCSWVRERAEASTGIVVFSNLKVPIGNTHLFTLRLLSLSKMEHIDKDTRVKIHSLVVMTGQLVKSLEALSS